MGYEGDWAFTRAGREAGPSSSSSISSWRGGRNIRTCTFTTMPPYEPAALKRLMGRYATREEEIDQMLRARLFVDLYSVVRHGIRASVESYSIKRLEPFYGFVRQASLPDANVALGESPGQPRTQRCVRRFRKASSLSSAPTTRMIAARPLIFAIGWKRCGAVDR